MLFRYAALIAAAWAHPTDSHAAEGRFLDKAHSLPDLVKAADGSVFPGFQLTGEAKQHEGRINLYGSGAGDSFGGVWLGSAFSSDAWTIELTFRLRNSKQQATQAPFGLSLWFVDTVVDTHKHHGGPDKYDGLQVLLSAPGGKEGLRAYLSDGAQVDTDAWFHECLFQYQDMGNTPTTMRVLYSKAENHWFKIQVDNRVCIAKQGAVAMPTKGYIGVLALQQAGVPENFEVLRMQVFTDVTEAARDDHGVIGGKQGVAVVQAPEPAGDGKTPNVDDLLRRLQELVESAQQGGLSPYLDTIAKSVVEVKIAVQQLSQDVKNSKNELLKELSRLLGNVQTQQGQLAALHKKVDLLAVDQLAMGAAVELVGKQAAKQPVQMAPNHSDALDTVFMVVKWFAIAVVALLAGLAFMVNRLQREVHRKLL